MTKGDWPWVCTNVCEGWAFTDTLSISKISKKKIVNQSILNFTGVKLETFSTKYNCRKSNTVAIAHVFFSTSIRIFVIKCNHTTSLYLCTYLSSFPMKISQQNL